MSIRHFAEQVLETNTNGIDLLRSVQHVYDLDEDWPSWVPHWDRVSTQTLAPSEMIPQPVSLTILCLTPNPIIRGLIVSDITARLNIISKSSSPSFLDELDLQALLSDASSQRRLCWTLTAGKNWYGLPVSIAEADMHMADFAAYVSAKHPGAQVRAVEK